jgi:chemotaxis receptor (MCP) glutamine deamidase CheD
MPFVKGQSGNPSGRRHKHIGDLSREARKYAKLALDVVVEICKKGAERNRLAAAALLLDRGYGRPVQALDLLAMGKKLSELTVDELEAVEARLISAPITPSAQPAAQSELFH